MFASYVKKVKTKSELLINLNNSDLDTEYFGMGLNMFASYVKKVKTRLELLINLNFQT
jgi:hypothetical protein